MFFTPKDVLFVVLNILLCSESLGNINGVPGSPNEILKTFFLFSTELKCGASTRLKKVTLRNPSKQVTDCTYTIKPLTPRVCQLRIDFDVFLAQPTATVNGVPVCNDDKLVVNGIELCGNNMNQHLYVPFNADKLSDSVKINFKTADRLASPHLAGPVWNVKVTQIDCPEKAYIPAAYDKLLPPIGCTQYFTEPNGTIESFNFNQGNGPYFANMNYAICIRRKTNNEVLTLRATSFELGQANPTNDGMDASCVSLVVTEGASEDHLSISEAVVTVQASKLRASKFCGKSLADSTITVNAPGPFVIQFKSDGQYDAKVEKGFKFAYTVA